MSTVNFYDILQIDEDATKKDIKKSYRKMAKKFHPDQPSGDIEVFELMTKAYNTLIDPKSRSEYDKLKLSNKKNSHQHLKEQSQAYISATDINKIYKSTTDRDNKIKSAKSKFKNEFDEFNKKHNYNSSEIEPLSPNTISQRFDDFKLAREQEDIENTHENIFQDNFDNQVFNNLWDSIHSGSSLVPHSGNPNAISNDSNFADLNSYNNLYATTNDSNSNFSSIDHDQIKHTISKKDLDKIKNSKHPVDDVIDDNYNQKLEEKMKSFQEYFKNGQNIKFENFYDDFGANNNFTNDSLFDPPCGNLPG